VVGGAVRGGQVTRASDAIGAYPDADPITLEEFGATAHHALGIYSETELLVALSRPVPVLRGEPILPLFGCGAARVVYQIA